MKRISSLILAVLLVFNMFTAAAFAANEPSLTAEAAVLIDLNTGEELYSKNKDEILYPASTTKLVTAMVVLDHLKMEDPVTVDAEAASMQGTVLKLNKGEQAYVKDVFNAMLVGSCNDCAVALAKACCGSVSAFVDEMNTKLLELGAESTQFTNPHGLHDENHYTTASDLVKIAVAAMEIPQIREVVCKADYTYHDVNGKNERYIENTNRLINGEKDADLIYVNNIKRHCKYDGCIGVKTGYTNAAGGCLIAAAEKNGTTLLSVVLKSDSLGRFVDSIKLLDWGFESYRTVKAIGAGTELDYVKVRRGAVNKVMAAAGEDMFMTLPAEASDSIISTDFSLDDSIKAPVEAGTVVGTVNMYESGTLIATAPAVTAQAVSSGGILSVFGVEDATAHRFFVTVIVLLVLFVLGLTGYVFYMRAKIKKKKAAKAARKKQQQEEEARRRALWESRYESKYDRYKDE